jgi:serine protease inhibitor
MTMSDDPDYQLYISEVCHNAFVDVNEKGTEAAAATDVIMDGATGIDPLTVPFTPTFKADRPFIFIIRDTSAGTILFMGRVTRPG